MPRPKQGVTSKNFLRIDNYFVRAFRFDRLSGKGWFNDNNSYYKAKEKFQKLPNINWSDESAKKISLDKRRKALQKWIDEHVSNEKWQRCLLSLRQDKSRKKLDIRQLNLKADIYRTVKIISQKKKITMGEVIRQLAEPVLAKIYKSEFDVEFKISKRKIHKKLKK